MIAVEVLHPLEVADGHAAGVAQDVRDHEDPALEHLLVGLGGRRAVGGLGDDSGLDVPGIPGSDLVLEGGRDQDVAVDLEDSRVADVLRAGQALDSPVLLLPAVDAADVETVGVVDATSRIRDGDHRGALIGDQPRSDRAGVAETLDRDAGAGDVHPDLSDGLEDAIDRSARGGFVSALRPAQADRLAGDDARHGVADVHGIRVHHPGHDLGVRVDVRGRDVLFRADEDLDLGEEPTGQRLELLLAELLRVDDDAALAAAVRDADDRALPRHPHRQRLDLVEADVLVIPNAALGRTASEVVLDAVARVDLDRPVVHLHREVDDQLAARFAKNATKAGVKVEALRGEVELLLGDLPGVNRRGDLLCGHGSR